MGISFRAVGIAVGVLMAFMVLPAKADTWHVTGQTDAAACAAVPGWCGDVTFALDLTTEGPFIILQNGGVHSMFSLLDMVSGQINGVSVSCVKATPSPMCGDLLFNRDYSASPIPDGNVVFSSGGILVGLHGGTESSVALPSYSSVAVTIGDTGAYTTWDIVQTPEPSALLLISVGLIGFLAIGIRRFSR